MMHIGWNKTLIRIKISYHMRRRYDVKLSEPAIWRGLLYDMSTPPYTPNNNNLYTYYDLLVPSALDLSTESKSPISSGIMQGYAVITP